MNLDPKEFEEYADKSIEDISENVMGVELPQKSERFINMMDVATSYYSFLHKAQFVHGTELMRLKNKLDELSVAYSEDPAFVAFLQFQRARVLEEAQ